MSEQNENQSKSEQMKDKANAAYRKASEKADALYSKLPLVSFREELNRHLHYIEDNFVSCFNQRLGSVRSVFQVVELDMDSLRVESPADGYSGEQWKGKCRLHDSQTGGEYMENFSCMLEWDKSGDEKYNTRSYDRPVELVPLMLHAFGKNNYLSDPRY